MNRTVVKTGLFLCALYIFAIAQPVHAQSVISTFDSEVAGVQTKQLVTDNQTVVKAQPKAKEESKPPVAVAPKPVEHVVQPGETLSAIADQHQTTWKRLFDKNVNIANPDIINTNDHLIIPTAEEQLTERPIPVTQPTVPLVSTAVAYKPQASTYPVGSSAGNSYIAGYCAWYAKNRRPDLPNNLGNAETWVARATAQGLATGSVPRVGAVGQQGNHVVYVEAVNGDGTVTISEMNYEGYSVVSSRTVPAGTFSYIY